MDGGDCNIPITFFKQEGHNVPKLLTSLYYVHQSYELMRPLGMPIFGPRYISRDPLDDATYQISRSTR